MTQLNTPYPATAYITGFLRQEGFDAVQADLAIQLVLALFSRRGLTDIFAELAKKPELGSSGRKTANSSHPSVQFFLVHHKRYISTIESAIRFLQGKDPSLSLRIISREFLPEGPRFTALSEGADPADPDPIGWAFGQLGVQDRAKYLASLMIDDLADVIRYGIDPHFELSRYAESLASSVATFDFLRNALEAVEPTLVDRYLEQLTVEALSRYRPRVVGLTAPFPGNVYGAFRVARTIKRLDPSVITLLGGGYVNTELRQLAEPLVFDYFDYVTLDDGERPLLGILGYLAGEKSDPKNLATADTVASSEKSSPKFLRTFLRNGAGQVIFRTDPNLHDIPHRLVGTPTYDGLSLDSYLSIFEMLNPMNRIWSDGRWNKLTLAHGCYWKKCNFCDVSLDYIKRYDVAAADIIVDRIAALVRETGQTGFHFVDEAAPPAVLRAMAERLIEREICITWWGNVRFDKAFTAELTELLARSGCVAVSGGLEVASDRLLKLMQKGTTVGQVARVTQSFTNAGIMVHAYLMYGFPTQTEQETVDSLERVRQLFAEGCIQSAYWHPFAATAHSPIGINPEKFSIKIRPEPTVTFARNNLEFDDPTGVDHALMREPLKKAIYNYMQGTGLDLDVRFWFGKRGKKYKVHLASIFD